MENVDNNEIIPANHLAAYYPYINVVVHKMNTFAIATGQLTLIDIDRAYKEKDIWKVTPYLRHLAKLSEKRPEQTVTDLEAITTLLTGIADWRYGKTDADRDVLYAIDQSTFRWYLTSNGALDEFVHYKDGHRMSLTGLQNVFSYLLMNGYDIWGYIQKGLAHEI